MTRVTGKVLFQGSTFSAAADYGTTVGGIGIIDPNEPPAPADGTVWTDTTTNTVKVYVDGTGWVPVLFPAILSDVAPSTPSVGTLWVNTPSGTTNVYVPNGWYTVDSSSGVTIKGSTGPAFLYSSEYETYITNVLMLTPTAYTESWSEHQGNVRFISNNGHTYAFDSSIGVSTMTGMNLFNAFGLSIGPDAIYSEFVVDSASVKLGSVVMQVGVESGPALSAGSGPDYVSPTYLQAFYNSDGSLIIKVDNVVLETHPAGTLTSYTTGDVIGMVIRRDGSGLAYITWFLNGAEEHESVEISKNMWFERARVNLGYNVVGVQHGPIRSTVPTPPINTAHITLSAPGEFVDTTYGEFTVEPAYYMPLVFQFGPGILSNNDTSIEFNEIYGPGDYAKANTGDNVPTPSNSYVYEVQVGVDFPADLVTGVSKIEMVVEGYTFTYNSKLGICYTTSFLTGNSYINQMTVPQLDAGDVIGFVINEGDGTGDIYVLVNGVPVVSGYTVPFAPSNMVPELYIYPGDVPPLTPLSGILQSSSVSNGTYVYLTDYEAYLNGIYGSTGNVVVSSAFEPTSSGVTYTNGNFNATSNYVPTAAYIPDSLPITIADANLVVFLTQPSISSPDINTPVIMEFSTSAPAGEHTVTSSLGGVEILFASHRLVWIAEGLIVIYDQNNIDVAWASGVVYNLGDTLGLAFAGNTGGDMSSNYVTLFKDGSAVFNTTVPNLNPTNVTPKLVFGPNIQYEPPV